MNGKAILLGGNSQSLDNIAGQPIAEYVHTKSGTVHKLEGPVNAKNIVFKATGDYNDGDTWILNNTPVAVTYNGGEELLPTAVLIGDVLQAVVMRNQLRLMLQKPTPQPSISDNWNLTKPVNQRAKDNYTGGNVYAFDRWVLVYGESGDANISLTSNGVKINGSGGIRQFFEADLKERICTIAVLDGENKLFTATSPILNIEGPEWQIGKHFENLWIGFRFREDRERTWDLTITALDKTLKAAKIEFGNRFTGWPAWDYGAELLKCQRYQMEFVHPVTNIPTTSERYGVLGTGMATSDTRAFIFIPTLVQIRTSPVISFKGNIRLRTGPSSNAAVRGPLITDIVRSPNLSNNGLCIICQVSKDTPLNVGEMYELWSVPSTEGNSLLADANL